MKLASYLISIVALFTFLNANSQERIFVDFGSTSESNASQDFTNNIATSYRTAYSNGVLLFNDQGLSTGINFQVHDAWLNINNSGTTAAAYQLGIDKNSSRDNFFGATGVFNGNTEVTAGFKLRNLDSNSYYSLSFFASRMNVTDNRETVYTITGSTTQTTALNASNNTSQTATAFNVQPDANGEIIISATAGANNTNSNGFYYLNALQLEVSSTPISQFTTQASLNLNYPVTASTWETGKTVQLLWKSEGIDIVTIEYSTDGGSTFSTITTVPATDSSYDFAVPNQLTSNAIVRLSNGSQLMDSAPINVIPDDGTVYRIVVLGSSTAAGSGPSSLYNAWVWKYRRFLEQLDTRYEVLNIAQGGFVTYNILPTGTTIPAGVNKTIDVNKNVTKAIQLGAHGIIINLPSNDAASNYPVTDQLHNYALIAQDASQNQIELWVTTPQPRNFGATSNQTSIQNQMVVETYNTFGNNAVDFWTGLGNTTGNQLLAPYNSGDGVHANNEAHQIFYERLIAKNIHGDVKAAVDAALNVTDIETPQIRLYPNPARDFVSIDSDAVISKIEIVNQLGQKVLQTSSNFNKLNLQELPSGFYLIRIQINGEFYTQRLIKQ